MEAISQIIRYWRQVVWRAVRAASKGLDVRAQTLEGLALLVIVAALSFGVASNLVSATDIEWLKSGAINALVRLVIAAVIIWLSYFIVHIVYQPSALDEERSDEINRLKEKWELEYVQACLEKDTFPNEASEKVGISIRNPLKQKLTHLHIELADALWIDDSGTNSLKTDNASPRHRFTDMESNEPESILDGETVRVNIATVDPHGHLILIPDERNSRKELAQRVYLWARQNLDSDFKIQLEITGRMDDRPITPELFRVNIRFARSRLLPAFVQSSNAPVPIYTKPVITIRAESNEEAEQKANN